MAEKSSSRLDLLYRISQTLNSSLELDVVMESLMDEVISVTKAERGFLMLYDADGALSFRTARGMDQQTIEESEFSISRGIVERVAQQGNPLLTSNAQMDERLDKRASVKLYGLRSVLCVPISQKEKVDTYIIFRLSSRKRYDFLLNLLWNRNSSYSLIEAPITAPITMPRIVGGRK